MNRTPCLALALAATLALTAPAAAQQPAPAPATALDEAYARLEEKLAEAQAAPASERGPKYEALLTECGAFLDAHLQAADPDQLTRAAGLWLTLAERLGRPESAIRARIAALRAREVEDELAAIIARVEAKLGLKPGAPAPAWTAADIVQGREVTLAGLRGTLVLMTFWSSTDQQSVQLQQERVRALHERHGRAGLVVVSVGVSEGGDTAAAEKALAEELRWPWRKVFDADGAIARAYGVEDVPSLALVDPEGKLVVIGRADTAWPQVERAIGERLGK